MPEMPEAEVVQDPGESIITQFSIYADNKVGRLNEIIGMLAERDIHVLAITTLDTTDSTIVRILVNYPEVAKQVLESNRYAFTQVPMIAVELPSVDYLHRVICALVQAEINIHYLYPFVARPGGKSGLAIRLEDEELACEVLKRHQIKVLAQSDLAR